MKNATASVESQRRVSGASLPFTVVKKLHTEHCLQPPTPLNYYTHTHTPVCRETFKRVYSPNNFKFMLLNNVLMLCVWTLVFAPVHSFLPLTKEYNGE